jgi:hypothetical protein
MPKLSNCASTSGAGVETSRPWHRSDHKRTLSNVLINHLSHVKYLNPQLSQATSLIYTFVPKYPSFLLLSFHSFHSKSHAFLPYRLQCPSHSPNRSLTPPPYKQNVQRLLHPNQPGRLHRNPKTRKTIPISPPRRDRRMAPPLLQPSQKRPHNRHPSRIKRRKESAARRVPGRHPVSKQAAKLYSLFSPPTRLLRQRQFC